MQRQGQLTLGSPSTQPGPKAYPIDTVQRLAETLRGDHLHRYLTEKFILTERLFLWSCIRIGGFDCTLKVDASC